MKIRHLETVLKYLTGKPIIEAQHDDVDAPDKVTSRIPLTLRMTLEKPFGVPSEGKASEERVKSYKVGLKVMQGTSDTDFTAEEITLIKDKVSKCAYPDVIAGQVCLLLEDNDVA